MCRRTLKALIVITAVCFGCNNDEDKAVFDKNGVAIKLPHVWKSSITDDGQLTLSVINTPIINDRSVLVGSRKNGERAILSLNSENGAVNWQWNDVMNLLSRPDTKDPISLYMESYYLENGRLFFTYTGSSYYLDLASGKTLWKYKIARSRFDRNAGLGGQYFTAGANYDPVDDDKIYSGELASSQEENLLLVPDYTAVSNPPFNGQGRVTTMIAFSSNGNKYLAFGIENPYTDQTQEGWGLTELCLYSITENKFVYSKIPLNSLRETRVIYDLIYDGENLFCQSSNFIHCFDAMTGYEKWRTRVGSPPVQSSMILAAGKLYTANEDRYMYCLNPVNGAIVWRKENTGTCSELSYLNGVIYFLGGGDGLLHAVDVSTGDQLWKVQSPDLKKNSGAFFYGACIAVPGQGDNPPRVVATNGLNAYGFEAIR